MEKKDVLVMDSEKFNNIITKAGDVNSLEFKTITEKSMEEIKEWMPVVNRKVNAFNKKNSQTTSSLMSLNMVDAAPYRILRQILAQAERKRMALKEVTYKMEMKKLKYNDLKNSINLTDIQKLKMDKMAFDIIDSQGHIEAALKELGALKRRYEEICKNNNIPEDWDEEDFEKQEIEHHIKSMFRNGMRDRLQGSHNVGTMEYFHQFGINSIVAYAFIDDYVRQVRKAVSENKFLGIEAEYEFLDKMYNIFKDEYKKAMKHLGIDNISHADYLMKE